MSYQKRYKSLWSVTGLLVVLALVLGACVVVTPQPAPQEAAEPAPEEAAEPAEAVEEEVEEAPAEAEAEMAEEVTPVVVASPVDVSTLDPHAINIRYPDRSVIIGIFDVLVWQDDLGQPVPELAESWQQIDDLTWEFKLREGVTFHNGEPFNAEAVKYSFERMQEPEFAAFNQIHKQTTLKEVKVIDDYTVQLITEEPTINMLYWLAESYIVPPQYYSEQEAEFLATNPVGSGPFKFVDWVRDDRVMLESNEDYYLGAPEIKALAWRVVPEASSRLNELQAGTVDVVAGLTPDQAEQANTDISKLVTVEGLRKMHLGIEVENGPEALQDARVRQALNYAVDVDTIVETLLGGSTSRLESFVNPPNNNPDLEPYTYDPDKARELLAEAGYPDGFSVVLQGPTDRWGKDQDIVLAIASYLEAIGLDVETEIMEWGTYRENLNNLSFKGLYYMGWAALINPTVEEVILTCGHLDNPSHYCNPAYDELVLAAAKTLDDEARMELIMEAQEIAWEDAPWVFLWRLPQFYGMSNRIEYTPRPDGYLDLVNAELGQ